MSEKTLSPLAVRIEAEVVAALKAKDNLRLQTLRFVRAALENKRIDKRGPLTDEDVIGVLANQAKQRRDSIEQFRAGKREDLAAKETAELAVIEEFLPQAMSEAEVREAVRAAIAETAAASPKDMGKVMAALMPRVKGRADGKLVNQLVRDLLAGGAG
jgi:uncharacterized protein YqeY